MNLAKRTADILVTNEEMLVHRTNIFGTKTKQFALSSIREVCMGHSGATINDRPVMEMQIINEKTGKKSLGLLSQRKEEELTWLVNLINYQLQKYR